jgi:hypothetical protein
MDMVLAAVLRLNRIPKAETLFRRRRFGKTLLCVCLFDLPPPMGSVFLCQNYIDNNPK